METYPQAHDNLDNNIHAVEERVQAMLRRERIVKRREERKQWLRERAKEARNGLTTTLLMGRWAIHQAARIEVSKSAREARENLLMRRWRRLSGDLAIMPYLGRNLFTV